MRKLFDKALAYWRCHTAARWGLVIIPAFAFLVWFGIGMVLPGEGAGADIKANLLNAGAFSVRVFVAVFFVHLVSHPKVWNWDLPNALRERLQAIMYGDIERPLADRIFAFVVLTGEVFAKLLLLWILLKALILWPQGKT